MKSSKFGRIGLIAILVSLTFLIPVLAQDELPEGHPPIAPAAGSGSAETAAPAGSGTAAQAPMGPAGSGTASPRAPMNPAGSASTLEKALKRAVPALDKGKIDLGDVTFQVPSSWEVQSPSSSMRKAQFGLPSGDEAVEDGVCAIFYFGPQAGDVEANIERWYMQFEQPDGKKSSDVAKRDTAKAGDIDVTFVDLSGTMKASMMMMGSGDSAKPGYRMLGAIAEAPSGPWFVKATGPEKVMARAAKDFRAFGLSIQAK